MRAVLPLVAWLVAAPLFGQTGGPLTILPPSPAPKYLTVATSASQPAARPGATLSLFVDIVPNPGIHVYAPGAKDYTPVALALGSPKDIVVGQTSYPKSERLLFANERVPVYQSPFRLTRAITLGRSLKPGTVLTLSGTVDYQACDDRVCFVPASVPVSWTVSVK